MISTFLSKAFWHPARLLGVGLLSLGLAACGGGGGSPGTNPNGGGTTGPTAASLALTFSSSQLTYNATTPVTVTAIVEDANHNGVSGVTVTFAADSGELVPAASPAVTDATGTVTATLTIGGNTASRTINVTAAGGGQSAKGTVQVIGPTSSPPSMNLLFNSPTVPSAGVAGTEVTVSAQVKDGSNNALAGVPVTFTADSGIVVITSGTTNANGLATATIGTGGNPTNRVINVSASGGGANATGSVSVSGTTISASSVPNTLTLNTQTQFTFNLQDSAGNRIANAPVNFVSAAGNTVVGDAVNGGTTSAPKTDGNGKVVFDVTAIKSGNDTLTVSADGASSAVPFVATGQSLSVALTDTTTTPATVLNVSPQPITEYTSTSCIKVDATYVNSGGSSAGSALVSTSRGTLFTDSACSSALSAVTVPFSAAGVMQSLYLSSTTPGAATVTVSELTGSTTGPTQSAVVTFISKIVSTSTPNITLVASRTTVAPNTASTPTAQASVLTATVRDGTPLNNLVQGVPVKFSLLTDSSGGSISPSVVLTQANGQAQATYYPGTGTTAQNGVQIQATIQSTVATNSAQTTLTVAGTQLFLTIGTGNTLIALDTQTYQQVWDAFVTDAAGNPVVGATVEGSLYAVSYTKGTMAFVGAWQPAPTLNNGFLLPNLTGGTGTWCPNTDAANNGVWSPTSPYQIYYPSTYPANPSLAGTVYKFVQPGIPGNVSSSGVTNASGYATLTLTYPKDHAYWTNVTLTATAGAQGSNSTTSANIFPLLGISGDYSSVNSLPPGYNSPYGVNASCVVAF